MLRYEVGKFVVTDRRLIQWLALDLPLCNAQITNPVYSFLSKNYYCKESKETPYTVHNRLINLEYQTVVITDKFSSGGDCNSYKEDDYSATMKVNAF